MRIVEAVGSSSRGWDAAIADAVRGARDEAPRPIGVEVTRMWADLAGGSRLRRYRAAVKIAYRQALVAQPARRAATRPARTRRSSRA